MPPSLQAAVQRLLDQADVRIDGKRPWDIQVHDPRLYGRVLSGGSLALGESYMDGWWDCERLDEFFYRILRADLDKKVRVTPGFVWNYAKAKLTNRQSRSRAFIIGKRHYDLGNDLYACMLDKRMAYSCGYWKGARTLDEAQEAKLDLACRKLKLKPGMRVLDIGCGWGSFARFACERYKVKVVGVTVSEEQARLARERCKGLDADIRVQDYRSLDERFDRIVSIGMFEHVGYKNYRRFFKVVERCLEDEGIFLLHTIASNHSATTGDPWIEKYIFPNGMLPSATQITQASQGLFKLDDWHNFGDDYDKTLLAWHANFVKHWGSLRKRYDARFRRMWEYYLLSCAGGFRAHKIRLWQIVFTKTDARVPYASVR